MSKEKTELFGLKMTPEEKIRLRVAAAHEDEAMSEFVRRIVFKEIDKQEANRREQHATAA